MKTFIEKIYFHREKEDNWDIVDQAEDLEFKCDTRDFKYLGMEVQMKIEVREDGRVRIIEIDGTNVEDKDLYLL